MGSNYNSNNFVQNNTSGPSKNMFGNTPSTVPPIPSFKGWNVASIEEVNAARVEFDGSIYVFPDETHKSIYTKNYNMNGIPVVRAYKEVPVETSSNYITREEFNQFVQNIQSILTAGATQKEVKPREEMPTPEQF